MSARRRGPPPLRPPARPRRGLGGRRLRSLALAWLALCAGCDDGPPAAEPRYADADPALHTTLRPSRECAPCHPRQVEEFAASPMAYAAFSPVFTAFERALNATFGGRFGPDGEGAAADFCVRCHAPTAVARGDLGAGDSLRDRLTHPSDDAITCELCHRAEAPARHALAVAPGFVKRGPLLDPQPNPFHGQAAGADPLLASAEFCGACHDVQVPGVLDVVAREVDADGVPFGRLEDLFSEWARSPWADADHPRNPLRGQPGVPGLHDGRQGEGEVVTCQDCHMSLYPSRGFADAVPAEAFAGVDPASLTRKAHKLYPTGPAAEAMAPLPRRRVSTHVFAGASHPLVPWPLDPALDAQAALSVPPAAFFDPDDPSLADARAAAEIHGRTGVEAGCEGAVDGWAQPACLHARRTALLRAAVTLSADALPAQAYAGGELDLPLWVENVGAGHRVPAGMSQERETWVELTLVDAGQPCTVDAECQALMAPRRFAEDPLTACAPDDPVYAGGTSVDYAMRAERSGLCDPDRRRCVVYRSGYLVDHDGDGRTHDEPLREAIVELDPLTLAETCVAPGPDVDQRGLGIDQGLVAFHNELHRVATDADGQPVPEPQAERWLRPQAAPVVPQPEDPPVLDQPAAARRSPYYTEQALFEQVRWQPAPHDGGRFGLTVGSVLRANRFFNGRSLAPFEPRLARYRVTVPEAVVGPLQVDARVRFRFFPPRTLRALAEREATVGTGLVHEAMIDRSLLIVDLAEISAQITVLR